MRNRFLFALVVGACLLSIVSPTTINAENKEKKLTAREVFEKTSNLPAGKLVRQKIFKGPDKFITLETIIVCQDRLVTITYYMVSDEMQQVEISYMDFDPIFGSILIDLLDSDLDGNLDQGRKISPNHAFPVYSLKQKQPELYQKIYEKILGMLQKYLEDIEKESVTEKS